jgi:hypothetical protein
MVCSPPTFFLVCCSLLPLLHCCASSCTPSTQHLYTQRCSVHSVLLCCWIIARNDVSSRVGRLLGEILSISVSGASLRLLSFHSLQHSCQSRMMRVCSWRKVNGDRGCTDRSELGWKHPSCARCTRTISTLDGL